VPIRAGCAGQIEGTAVLVYIKIVEKRNQMARVKVKQVAVIILENNLQGQVHYTKATGFIYPKTIHGRCTGNPTKPHIGSAENRGGTYAGYL